MIKKGDISIIGAGSWGTSIAKVIAENHRDVKVKMWAYEKEVVRSINNYNVNNEFLPGVELPANLSAYSDIREAVENCFVVIFATPSKVIYETSLKARKFISDKVFIGYLTKGFCKVQNDILPISDTLARVFPDRENSIVAIYGPSHAEEVSKGFHTCLNIAGRSREARRVFMELLSTDYMGCREIEDIRGVDLGTTLKNPAAIAAGILKMLPKCGDNLAGVLIVEALGEMLKLGRALDVKDETLLGICGLGDLVGTALSEHSRNRRFGKDIAGQIMKTGKFLRFYDRLLIRFNPDHVLEKMSERLNYLAEGAYAIEPIIELAERKNVSIPVYKALYEILLNKKDPALLIETVKKPDKFEEIFEKTKIITSDKKKGLEKATGSVFKRAILRDILSRYQENPELIDRLLRLRTEIMEQYKEKRDGLNKNMSDFADREYELFRKLEARKAKRGIKNICQFYLDDISDNFNYFGYKVIIKGVRFLNFFRQIFGKRYNRKLLESNIKISGNLAEIRKVNQTSNVVYASTYRSCFDFAYIIMAVDKHGLHIPRFAFDRRSVGNKFKEYIIRSIGGYIIDFSRLDNPLYQEVIRNYLATLIGHGVHIVFFPELKISRDGNTGSIREEFLSLVMDSLFKNTEEIALVPIELSYYARPDNKIKDKSRSVTLNRIIENRVNINFSDPLFASDFSNENNNLANLSMNIEKSWNSDSAIFPHYIFCGAIRDKDYRMPLDSADSEINEFLAKKKLNGKYKVKDILKEGTDFIVKRKIGRIDNDEIIISNTEEIDYYSNLVRAINA